MVMWVGSPVLNNVHLIIRKGSWNIKHIVIEFVLIVFVEKVCYMEDGSFI